MPKINLSDLTNLQNESSAVSTINTNNATIEVAFDNTLSRDGTTPNMMLADLDMNSNNILNLPITTEDQNAVSYGQVVDMLAAEFGGGLASYVVTSSDATLTNERVLTGGNRLNLTDGGPGNAITLDVSDIDLVDLSSSQILSNKTISGSNNTITNVNLATGVTGNLAVSHLNSGTSASAATFWRGDGTWSTPAGAGDLLATNNLSDLDDIPDARTNLGFPKIFRPEEYGGQANNPSHDNSAAFVAMSTAVRAAGGGIIEFEPFATYTYLTVNPAPGNYYLFDISDTRGVIWNQNGAKITTPINFDPIGGPADPVVTVIGITCNNTHDAVFNDIHFEQSFYTQRPPNDPVKVGAGTIAVQCWDYNTNLIFNNTRMNAGVGGLWFQRNAGLAQNDRTRNITINGGEFNEVFYPLSFQKNGDNVTVRGVKTRRAGRTYFPYNVHQHDIEVESDAADSAQDAIVSNSFEATEDAFSNTTSDIRIKYTSIATGTGTPNAYLCTTFQTSGGSAEGQGIIRNIHFDVNIRHNTQGPILLMCLNQTSTSQNRTFENVSLTGTYQSDAVVVNDLLQLFVDKNWNGDQIINFKVEDFTVQTSGTRTIQVDGRAIRGPFTFRNISNGKFATGVAFNPVNFDATTRKWLRTENVFWNGTSGVNSWVAPATQWSFDTSIQPVTTLTNGSVLDMVYGDGMFIITENTGLVGGVVAHMYANVNLIFNYASSLSNVQGTASKLNIFWNSGTNTIRFQNLTGSTLNLLITSFKTRGI